MRTGASGASLTSTCVLEQALKKSGWRGPRAGAQRLERALDRVAQSVRTRIQRPTRAMTRARKSRASSATAVDTKGYARHCSDHGRSDGPKEPCRRCSAANLRWAGCEACCATAATWASRSPWRARDPRRARHRSDRQAKRVARVQGDAKRWVVERSFAWLDKNRRLWKRERLLNTACSSSTCILGFAVSKIVNRLRSTPEKALPGCFGKTPHRFFHTAAFPDPARMFRRLVIVFMLLLLPLQWAAARRTSPTPPWSRRQRKAQSRRSPRPACRRAATPRSKAACPACSMRWRRPRR